jgi:hypothetical protein
VTLADRLINQSPLSTDPNVPKGTQGIVSDFDDMAGVYIVDFGLPYGDVICSPEELDFTR